jgi:flagellar biogenesis protein FliO
MHRALQLLVALVAVCEAAKADPRLVAVDVPASDKEARLSFKMDGAVRDVPKVSVKENVLELLFAGVTLEEGKKIDLVSPHVLISRVSVFEPEKGRVKARIVVNGSVERLRERLTLTKSDSGVLGTVALPDGENPTLSLLKEEQLPLAREASGGTLPKVQSGWAQTLVPLFLLLVLCAGGLAGFRYLKGKGKLGGSRKYLVEHVSYCPVGHGGKAGVSLVRVGPDFYLVGVTAGQVNLLSAMPQLSNQYKEETKLERESFQEAVAQEVKRLRGKEYTA